MRLKCPECGAEILAENINVQQMVAVCHVCHAVFSFDVSEARRKRRKVRQPKRLELSEARDRLTMRYQRVYNEEEQGVAIGTVVSTVMLFAVMVAAIVYEAPVFISVGLAFLVAFGFYAAAALLFNQTTVTMDDEQLTVRYGPLPWMTGTGNIAFERQHVAEVFCEETEKSRDTVSATRYYHVRGRLQDGDIVTLFKGMAQDYALYITQELNAMLEDDRAAITARLEDGFEAEAALDANAAPIITTHQQRR